jgi:hypothetical protein
LVVRVEHISAFSVFPPVADGHVFLLKGGHDAAHLALGDAQPISSFRLGETVALPEQLVKPEA